MKHKNRLAKLEKQIPGGGDDEILVIRLVWDDGRPMGPGVAYKRSGEGRMIFPLATVRWPDDAA